MEKKYVWESGASPDDAPKENKSQSILLVRILCFIGTAFFLFFAITTMLGYSVSERHAMYSSLFSFFVNQKREDISTLRAEAEQGDSNAQFLLGIADYPTDFEEAIL